MQALQVHVATVTYWGERVPGGGGFYARLAALRSSAGRDGGGGATTLHVGCDTSHLATHPEGPRATGQQEGLASPPEGGRPHIRIPTLNRREDSSHAAGAWGHRGDPEGKTGNGKGLTGSVFYFLTQPKKEPSGNAFLICIISLPWLPVEVSHLAAIPLTRADLWFCVSLCPGVSLLLYLCGKSPAVQLMGRRADLVLTL